MVVIRGSNGDPVFFFPFLARTLLAQLLRGWTTTYLGRMNQAAVCRIRKVVSALTRKLVRSTLLTEFSLNYRPSPNLVTSAE